MRTTTQKGFTLVELAIVMTIIGLLIGGILKGQEMIANARVTATIAQVKAIEAATTTFRDAYNAFPGDIPQASQRVPGCTAACDDSDPAELGNGIVGVRTYGGTAIGQLFNGATQAADLDATAEESETVLFWAELSASNLLSGITTRMLNGGTSANGDIAWGVSHPVAKIAGGFVVGNSLGGYLPDVQDATSPNTIVGTVLALLPTPTTALAAGATTISATKAAQIDRKMDDGIAYTGAVQAFGDDSTAAGNGCANGQGTDSSQYLNYQENSVGNTCGLVFQIQS